MADDIEIRYPAAGRYRAAAKAIELYEALVVLFERPEHISHGSVAEMQKSHQVFGGIFTELARQRFELERVRLEGG